MSDSTWYRRGRRATITVILSVSAVVVSGCGWTNEERASSGMIFDSAVRLYAKSRANGELGQAQLRSNRVEEARLTLSRSARFAVLMTRGEELRTSGSDLNSEQAEFLDQLRDLTISWSVENSLALEEALDGDNVEMNRSLRQANEVEEQIDLLITGTDLAGITDGESDASDFTKEVERNLDALKAS